VSRPAVPELTEAMKAAENEGVMFPFDISVQEVATVAIGRATGGTDDAVPLLMETLDGARSGRMRRAAARALGEVGASARPAMPRLQALLDDNDPETRDAARVALKLIGKEQAPPG
jgi:hypothetical protein